MRRFSQRSHLVTLNEINVTPLLDLAFVLLIIFIITTPLLEHGRRMQLPQGGEPDPVLTEKDFRTLDVESDTFFYRGIEVTFAQLRQALALEKQNNPNVLIFIRADRARPWQGVFDAVEVCAELGLAVSFRTEPSN